MKSKIDRMLLKPIASLDVPPLVASRLLRLRSSPNRRRCEGVSGGEIPFHQFAPPPRPSLHVSMVNRRSACRSSASHVQSHFFMCYWRRALSTCFVSMSAGFSLPAILLRAFFFFRIRSWIHKSAVAKCLTFPSPRLRAIPIAAVASVITVTSSRMPRSAARDCKPKDWAAPLHIPVNSASADDRATVD